MKIRHCLYSREKKKRWLARIFKVAKRAVIPRRIAELLKGGNLASRKRGTLLLLTKRERKARRGN